MGGEDIFNHRKNKFLSIGRSKGYKFDQNSENDLTDTKKSRYDLLSIFSNKRFVILGISVVLLLLLIILN